MIDFGLAKAIQESTQLTERTLFTQHGQVVGTLAYMSPEQAEMNALDVDTRTDVYSLGVLLYELLTGSTPISQDQIRKEALDRILRLIREEDPPRPSARISESGDAITGISQQRRMEPRRLGLILKGDLDWITVKALEKDRNRRYGTASALGADVKRYLSGEPIEARPPSGSYRLKKFVARHRQLVIAVTALVACILVGAGVSIWFAIAADKAREIAVDEKKRADESAARSQAVLQIVTDAFDSIDPETGATADMPAKQVLLNVWDSWDENDLDDEGRSTLLRTLSTAFLGLGEYATAIETTRAEAKLNESLFGSTHARTLESQVDLGAGLSANGQRPEAIELLERLANEQLDRPEVPQTLRMTALFRLAMAHIYERNPEQAVTILTKLIPQQEDTLGKDEVAVLKSKLGLAMAYGSRKENEKSLEILEEIGPRFLALQGRLHPDTQRCILVHAANYRIVGRLDDAITLLKRAVDAFERSGGGDHPWRLAAMEELATTYEAAGHYRLAIQTLESMVPIALQKNPDHPGPIQSQCHLGYLYLHDARSQDAIVEFEKAHDTAKRVLGPCHGLTIHALSGLVTAYADRGLLRDATRLLEARVQTAKELGLSEIEKQLVDLLSSLPGEQ